MVKLNEFLDLKPRVDRFEDINPDLHRFADIKPEADRFEDINPDFIRVEDVKPQLYKLIGQEGVVTTWTRVLGAGMATGVLGGQTYPKEITVTS